MKQIRFAVLLSLTLLTACAAHYAAIPPVTNNLSSAIAASGIVQVGGDCYLVANLKNGRLVKDKLASGICKDILTGIAIEHASEAAARQQQQAPVPQAEAKQPESK